MNWTEWTEQNPLKQWMEKYEVKKVEVASYLECAPWTVYYWIRGFRPKEPDESFWRKLIDLTGDEDFKGKWLAWEERKPPPGGRKAK